ncbi:MAG: hypothetical protein HZA48_07920 [Planctomycetes bacterium]|nr:hypothetical protein [Planctomycetota bacterium]
MTGYRAFVRWTKRNQRLIFYILIGIIAIGFGVTGPMLQFCAGSKKQVSAGVVFGEYIPRSDYDRVYNGWEKLLRPSGSGRSLFYSLNELGDTCEFELSAEETAKIQDEKKKSLPVDMSEEEKNIKVNDAVKEALVKKLEASAWNAVILLHEAKKNNIIVTNIEIGNMLKQKLGWFYRYYFKLQEDPSPEGLLASIAKQSDMTETQCLEIIREIMMVEKYIAYLKDSVDVPMDEVFQKYVKNQTNFLVQGAGFHRQDFAMNLEVTAAELAKYYNENKDKFKTPEKYKLQYVFVSKEKFRSVVPEPEEQALKDKYEAGKKSGKYQISNPEEKKPGVKEEPKDKPVQYKAFDEVKDEIKKEIIEQGMKTAAYKQMSEVRIKIKNKLDEIEDFKVKHPGNPAVPEVLLEKLTEGMPDVVCANTPYITLDNVDELEKDFGKFDKFKRALQSSFSVNEISTDEDTDKGLIMFKLLEKIPSVIPPFTAGLESAVKSEIVKQKSRELAKTAAEEFMKEAEAKLNEIKTQDEQGKPFSEETMRQQKVTGFMDLVNAKGLAMKPFSYKRDASVTDIGDADAFKNTVDSLKKGELAIAKTYDPSFKDQNKSEPDIFYVIQLQRVDPPAPRYKDFDDEVKNLRTTLKNDRWKDYWKTYWATLYNQAELESYLDEKSLPAPSLPDSDY